MLRISSLLPAFVLSFLAACGDDGDGGKYKSCDDVVCGDHASCGGYLAECSCNVGYAGDPYDRCFAEQPKSCDELVCGDNATCDGDPGECSCDAGYAGDPYKKCIAEQPPADETCALECGQNAYCSEGECFCELDHVAVCGANAGCLPEARLCDHQQDCPNAADEAVVVCSTPLFQDWLLTDDCDDGLPIEWRLFAQDREWSWPDGASSYKTTGLGAEDHQTVQCFEGEYICFGGRSGAVTWGFNLDGSGSCDACCAACGSQSVLDIGFLTCD
ncbi:MAG TPA: hypothetical protein VGB85_15930 [Nannocystis sp.]|jgi:hypothetical protein